MSNSTSNKQLLIIGYVWPEPNSSAAGSHMMSLIEAFLAHQWQVTFASPAAIGEHKEDLTKLGVDEVPIALNCSSFDTFVHQLQPDAVIFDRFMLEEQFAWRVAKQCPKALRILDTEDLHSLRQARHQALKQGRDFCFNDLYSDTAMREIAAILRSDLTLILSSYELGLLQEHFNVPASHLLHNPFMLELPDSTLWLGFEQKQHFISIGNFRHAPNWDAVLWLKQQIWPRIRKALPEAELHIYGAYPPKKATDLHNVKQGFLVKGWAESATEVMSSARVCLAPLRFGAGIKGKLTEAMQCGTPSVTTDIGIEGMAEEKDWSGSVANDPQNFAESAISLYQNKGFWQQCQQQGSSILAQYFDKQTLAPALVKRVETLTNQLDKHRDSHFLGKLLNHQSMAASRYMSQWIEAKNRKQQP